MVFQGTYGSLLTISFLVLYTVLPHQESGCGRSEFIHQQGYVPLLIPIHRLVHVHRSWYYSQEMREELGEVYLIVTSSQIFMSSSNAQATMQMISRRVDFVKPVEIYAIVDIFGSSILTTEGSDWKRHRKIVAPAFSEKSNAVVWRETLRQTVGMINVWSKLKGNDLGDMIVNDTAPYTALMALHVICAAGFGVRQLWDGEDESKLGTKVLPGFNTAKLPGKHTLTFKDALNTLLHGIIWLAIFPVSLLSMYSPAHIIWILISS